MGKTSRKLERQENEENHSSQEPGIGKKSKTVIDKLMEADYGLV